MENIRQYFRIFRVGNKKNDLTNTLGVKLSGRFT